LIRVARLFVVLKLLDIVIAEVGIRDLMGHAERSEASAVYFVWAKATRFIPVLKSAEYALLAFGKADPSLRSG
jgi:hypothetical protein